MHGLAVVAPSDDDEVVHNLGDSTDAAGGNLRWSKRHEVTGAGCSLDGRLNWPGGSVRDEEAFNVLCTQLERVDLLLESSDLVVVVVAIVIGRGVVSHSNDSDD